MSGCVWIRCGWIFLSFIHDRNCISKDLICAWISFVHDRNSAAARAWYCSLWHISILPIPICLPESVLHRYLYAHQPQQHDLLISFWNLMLLFSLTWLASHQSSVSLIPDYENAPVKWFSSSPWLNRYTQLTFLIFSCLDGYLFMV